MTRTSRQECRARAHARPRQNSVYATTQHTSPSEPSAKFTPRTVSMLAQLQHPSARLSHRLQAASLGEEGRTIEQRRVQIGRHPGEWIYIRSETLERARAHDVSRFGLAPGGLHGVPDSMEESLAPSRRMSVSDIERCVHKRRIGMHARRRRPRGRRGDPVLRV